MAHRGRLNVMAHVLDKPYAADSRGVQGSAVVARTSARTWPGPGDVKYHAGAQRAIKDGRAMEMNVSMPPNPSHLEAVDPVVEGMARAAGTPTDTAGRAATSIPAAACRS